MVNRVCAPDALLSEALETAAVIADNAPISMRQIKQSVNHGLHMDLRSGMMFEIEAYNRMVPTEDRREGIRAFNEKRKPEFTGEVERMNRSQPQARSSGKARGRLAMRHLPDDVPRLAAAMRAGLRSAARSPAPGTS